MCAVPSNGELIVHQDILVVPLTNNKNLTLS